MTCCYCSSETEKVMDQLLQVSHLFAECSHGHELEKMSHIPPIKQFKLHPLDQASITKLLQHIFSVVLVDMSVFAPETAAVVHQFSAGNPLIAVEIAKAVIPAISAVNDTTSKEALVIEFLKSLKSHRIEEIILYRFDGLTQDSQIVLKAAAVAGYDGRKLSLKLLESILESMYQNLTSFRRHRKNSSLSNCSNVSSPLLLGNDDTIHTITSYQSAITASSDDTPSDIELLQDSALHDSLEELQKQGFIIKSQVDSNPFLTEEQGAAIQEPWTDVQITFASQLDRIALYDMLLKDQKKEFHSKIAKFLEECYQPVEKLGLLTSTELYVLGRHYEGAAHYSRALVCYYRAGLMLRQQGARAESHTHLICSYRMLSNMYRTVGYTVDNLDMLKYIGQSHPHMLSTDAHDSEKTMRMNSFGENNRMTISTNIDDEDHENNSITLSRELIRTMCEGDIHLLETAINMLIKLGQSFLSMPDLSGTKCDEIYNEALHLLMLTSRCLIDDWAHLYDGKFTSQDTFDSYETADDLFLTFDSSPHRKRSPHHHDSNNHHRQELLLESPDLVNRDVGRDVGPYSHTHRSCDSCLSPRIDENDNFYITEYWYVFAVLSGKLQYLSVHCDQIPTVHNDAIKLARNFVVLAKEYGDPVHIVRSLSSQIDALRGEEFIFHALQSLEKLLNTYCAEEHSKQLITLYGQDWALVSINGILQHIILSGNSNKSNYIISYMENHISKMESKEIYAIVIIGYCCRLMSLHYFEKALKLLNILLSLPVVYFAKSLVDSLIDLVKIQLYWQKNQYRFYYDNNMINNELEEKVLLWCQNLLKMKIEERTSLYRIANNHYWCLETIHAKLCWLLACQHLSNLNKIHSTNTNNINTIDINPPCESHQKRVKFFEDVATLDAVGKHEDMACEEIHRRIERLVSIGLNVSNYTLNLVDIHSPKFVFNRCMLLWVKARLLLLTPDISVEERKERCKACLLECVTVAENHVYPFLLLITGAEWLRNGLDEEEGIAMISNGRKRCLSTCKDFDEYYYNWPIAKYIELSLTEHKSFDQS